MLHLSTSVSHQNKADPQSTTSTPLSVSTFTCIVKTSGLKFSQAVVSVFVHSGRTDLMTGVCQTLQQVMICTFSATMDLLLLTILSNLCRISRVNILKCFSSLRRVWQRGNVAFNCWCLCENIHMSLICSIF